MSQSPRLTVELVPATCWYSNVRSNVPPKIWKVLQQNTFGRANHRCEVCGGRGRRWPVEAHEIWEYDDSKRIQRLTGLIALCPACHEVKHIGLAEVRGRLESALAHLARINDWSASEARHYVEECFRLWEQRSRYPWQLDLSWLSEQGIPLPRQLDRTSEPLP